MKNACQRDDSRKPHAVILDIPQGSRMAMLQLNGIVNFSIEVLGCSQAAKTSGNSHTETSKKNTSLVCLVWLRHPLLQWRRSTILDYTNTHFYTHYYTQTHYYTHKHTLILIHAHTYIHIHDMLRPQIGRKRLKFFFLFRLSWNLNESAISCRSVVKRGKPSYLDKTGIQH